MGLARDQTSLRVPLESVLCTEQLTRRPARPPNSDELASALVALAQTLAGSPEQVLQELAKRALDLCAAHSAGVSLLEEQEGRKIFRWHGLAGQFASHLWSTTPREFSPCGTVLDTDKMQLMSHLDRHFTYFGEVKPHIEEAVLIPFHVRGEAVGTVWVVSHDQTRRFDAEDVRVMTALGAIAAAAYQALSGTLAMRSIFATNREPLLVLDSNLRVLSANRAFYQTFEISPTVTEGNFLYQLGNGEWNIPELRLLLESMLPEESKLKNFEVTQDFPGLGRRAMAINARKLWREGNSSRLILLGLEDITDSKRSEGEVRRFREKSQRAFDRLENLDDGMAEVTHTFDDIIGSTAGLRHVLKQVEVVAPTDATVLILGETGAGKELIARALHRLSSRKNLPFVSLNCAAIPTGLLESELFGYERGAFTGAMLQKRGRFELANGGTLFLDEVGDMPLDLQPKLLRALQEKAVERLGGTKSIPVDFRLVAATNQNLTLMMGSKLFRSDFYYRLMVFPIVVPPLRAHADDIPALVSHFTKKYAMKMNRQIDTIPCETMRALQSYSWPGNIRELESFIERSVILSRGSTLNAPISELRDVALESGKFTLEETMRDNILRAFRDADGVVSRAANRLGIPRTTLNAKLRRLGISRRDL